MHLIPEQIEQSPIRKIRSFIRRQGRITQGQQFALDNYWKKYSLDPSQKLDKFRVFGRDAPLYVEIGFGNGECLAQIASDNPEKDYIGIEVHRPGMGHLIMQLEQRNLRNVRVYFHDAVDVLTHSLLDKSLSGVHLFFPDPWPKKKHHKRRIVQSGFLDLVAKRLKSGGYFHAATDWENYAGHMLDVLSANQDFSNTSSTNTFCERPDYRPLTKFEQRGLGLGHGVWDLLFVKQ